MLEKKGKVKPLSYTEIFFAHIWTTFDNQCIPLLLTTSYLNCKNLNSFLEYLFFFWIYSNFAFQTLLDRRKVWKENSKVSLSSLR